MMCTAIDNPASCEIRAVILILHAKKKKSAAEIQTEEKMFQSAKTEG
jgi:hypothetical protein